MGKVGALADVVAPPYDVIDSEYQDELYKLSDYNVIRLILNRGDDLTNGQIIVRPDHEVPVPLGVVVVDIMVMEGAVVADVEEEPRV